MESVASHGWGEIRVGLILIAAVTAIAAANYFIGGRVVPSTDRRMWGVVQMVGMAIFGTIGVVLVASGVAHLI